MNTTCGQLQTGFGCWDVITLSGRCHGVIFPRIMDVGHLRDAVTTCVFTVLSRLVASSRKNVAISCNLNSLCIFMTWLVFGQQPAGMRHPSCFISLCNMVWLFAAVTNTAEQGQQRDIIGEPHLCRPSRIRQFVRYPFTYIHPNQVSISLHPSQVLH